MELIQEVESDMKYITKQESVMDPAFLKNVERFPWFQHNYFIMSIELRSKLWLNSETYVSAVTDDDYDIFYGKGWNTQTDDSTKEEIRLFKLCSKLNKI